MSLCLFSCFKTFSEELTIDTALKLGISAEIEQLPSSYKSKCSLVTITLPKTIPGKPELDSLTVATKVRELESKFLILTGQLTVTKEKESYNAFGCLPIRSNLYNVELTIVYDYSGKSSSGHRLYIINLANWLKNLGNTNL